MPKKPQTSRERLYQKVAIITSCLAVGAAASSGVVNHNAQARSDANACALKSFLTVIAERTKANSRPGAEEITKKYYILVDTLKPDLTDCPAKYVIK